MLSAEEIHEWLNKKFENYIKNYPRKNKLTLMQERSKLFIGMHEKFLETILIGIKAFLENCSRPDLKIKITSY